MCSPPCTADRSGEQFSIAISLALFEKREKITLLFRSSVNQRPWSGRSLSEWFTGPLKLSKVRHRGANQCRHTFASQALSSYVPIEWVARQLGHSDTTMVKKHYGRWIPANTKSMAKMVSENDGIHIGLRRAATAYKTVIWSDFGPKFTERKEKAPLHA